jgi:hypothetical protein
MACQIDEALEILRDTVKNGTTKSAKAAQEILTMMGEDTTSKPDDEFNAQPTGNYGAELVKAIKARHNVEVNMNMSYAMLAIEGKEFASSKGNTITYPDFDTLIANPGALVNLSKKLDISVDAVVAKANELKSSFHMDMTKVHEHIHIQSVSYMENNPNSEETKYVNRLFTQVQSFAAKNPEHAINNVQKGYWKTNVKEFIAVALSNPEMIQILGKYDVVGKQVVKPNNSILGKLVSKLLQMVGVKSDTATGALLTTLMNMEETVLGSMDGLIKKSATQVKEGLSKKLVGVRTQVVDYSNKAFSGTIKYVDIVKKNKILNIGFTNGKSVQLHSDGQGNWRSNNGMEVTVYGDQSIADIYNEVLNDVLLNSDEKQQFEYRDGDIEPNIMDSVDNMIEMADLVEDISPVKTSPDMINYYKDTIASMINTDFIPKMKYYLHREGSKTHGQVEGRKIGVNVSANEKMLNGEMGAQEVHWHEILHAMTKFALSDTHNNAIYAIRKKIEYLRKEAEKVITIEHLMPEKYVDGKAEFELAKARHEYIFSSENGLHEFIAFGMTNEKVINILKQHTVKEDAKPTTLWEQLKAFVGKLLDVATMKYSFDSVGKTQHSALMQLTLDLHQYNNKAENKLSERADLGIKIYRVLEKGNVKLSKLRESLVTKMGGTEIAPPPPDNASKWEMAKWMAHYLPKLLVRDDMKGYRELVLTQLGMSPEGFIQNVLRDLTNPDELERLIERISINSDSIDRVRNTISEVTRVGILEEFDEKLTEYEEEMLTYAMLDIDLESIYGEYDIDSIVELYSNPSKVKEEIAKSEARLKKLDPKNSNWNITQAKGLGRFMLTHEGGLTQNLNASNIARGILTESRREPSAELVAEIDKLATLTGIKGLSGSVKADFVKRATSDKSGIEHLLNLSKAIKKESREKLFDTDVNLIKGYSKELFDDSIDIQFKPVDMKDEMRAQGYTLESKLPSSSMDKNEVPMGIYRATSFVGNTHNRGALRMTNTKKRGTSLSDIAYAQDDKVAIRLARKDINKAKIEVRSRVRDIEKGKGVEDDGKLTPVLNDAGDIVNFRYMMSKANKKQLLNQDTKISTVLGKTNGSISDKVDTITHNEAVLDVIMEDMEKNYVEGFQRGNNGQFYVKIENNSPDKKIQELYRIMPANVKLAIKSSKNGYIAVRKDMVHNYFGFREGSILDIHPLIGKIDLPTVKRWIVIAEKMWQELVKISKVDIVIRTPAVFIGNVVSNFMFSVINGASPVRVAKMQYANWVNTNEYVKMVHEIEKLKLSEKITGEKNSRITGLESTLKANPVHDLMEAGMYQTIIEDIERADFKSNNKISSIINEKTKGAPSWVKQGVHWVYISDQTSLFKFMTTATQLSDFVARATEYQLMAERGVSKEARINHVLDTFVNYNKPASRFEEYLNDMGLIMFTKYAKRIQRAIARDGKSKPLNIILAALAQEMTLGVDDIYDQNMLTRNYSTIGINPIDHVLRVLTPTALEPLL